MERDLCEAIEKVDINSVTSILNETPQLIYLKINNQGQLPLTLACEQSNEVLDLGNVKTLIITLKRAIGLPDMRGVYPIHAIVISNASESNKTKLIEKLLNCGVMEIEGSNKGLLNQKVTRALPRRGAADAIRNRMGMVMEGDTALHLAVRNKNIYVVNYLMKEDHIDPNIQNTEGKTPFHIAAKEIYHEGMKDIFETLSNSKRVKLDIVDNDGETAYSIYAKINPDIN